MSHENEGEVMTLDNVRKMMLQMQGTSPEDVGEVMSQMQGTSPEDMGEVIT